MELLDPTLGSTARESHGGVKNFFFLLLSTLLDHLKFLPYEHETFQNLKTAEICNLKQK